MKNIKSYLFVCIFLIVSMICNAQSENIIIKHYNIEDNIALEGYDAVSYFSNKAIKGNKKYSVISQGIMYYFMSETTKDIFAANPEKYKPQFGGWCAYAMGEKGEKVNVDPETFKIVDGKLYLFYNAYFNNTLKSWNKDEKNIKNKADLNWKKIFN